MIDQIEEVDGRSVGPLRPSRRGLSDAVIDPIGGPALVLRPHHWVVPMQVLRLIKGASKALQTHLLSRCSTERPPIGDSAILHPSAGAEETQTDHVSCGAHE